MRYLTYLLTLMMVAGSHATAQDNDRLPSYSDIVSVRMPDDFYQADGEGLFSRFSYRFFRDGEGPTTWSQMVELNGLGDSIPAADLRPFARQHMRTVARACSNPKTVELDRGETRSVTRIDFSLVCGKGGEGFGLKTMEIGRFRFMTSASGTYVFAYVWRGDSVRAAREFSRDKDAFWLKAADFLDHFSVCDVALETTCWVDRDVIGEDSIRETDNTLRCRQDPNVACNPTAMLIFRPGAKHRPMDGVEKEVGILRMDQDNIDSFRFGLLLLKDVEEAFARGVPEFVLIVKPGDDPDHDVSFDERARVAAFFNLLGETAVQKDIVESYGTLFLNFH